MPPYGIPHNLTSSATDLDEVNENIPENTQENYNIEYSNTLEQLIKSKGEQCEVLSKLHLMAHKRYKRKELYFNIPIITITAVVGFISALNVQYEYMNIIIGVLSLYVSLLKSYLSFLKISQKNENHRVAYLQYFQIANEMRIELSLSPELRKRPSYLLSLIKVKMKNLNEVSEIIPTNIISDFNKSGEMKNNEITQPDIIMSLHTFKVYDSHQYESTAIQQSSSKPHEHHEPHEPEEGTTICGTCV
jgi:hypothetical protein